MKNIKKCILLFLLVFLCIPAKLAYAAEKPDTPALKSAISNSYNSVKLTWGKVSGANGYYVYHKTSGGEWKRIKEISSGSTVTYTDTGLTCGTKYIYTVKAYKTVNGKKTFGGYSKKGISCTPVPSSPSLVSVTKKSVSSVAVKWKKVSGANGYYVYHKTPEGEWTRVKTITSASTVSYTDTGLTPGQTYTYTVKAYRIVNKKKVNGTYNKTGLTITLPMKAVELSASKISDTRIKLSWTACKDAEAYQVWRSITKNGGYTKVKTSKELSFTDTGLTKGMTYYYKIRAYKKDGDSIIYSEWGKIHSISLPSMFDSGKNIKPLADGVNIYIAGDSTTRNYASNGIFSGGSTLAHGSWGEYLQCFFSTEKIQVNNYGAGGRSTRSFINEGYLDKIKKTITKGDYLFIQFGHNDRNASKEGIYTPLGTPDKDGVYPVTPGKKTKTPDDYVKSCGETWYSSKSGTFKWYLYQYVNTALDAGATPVLVTPVSRLYFNSNGKIYAHHDDSSTDSDNWNNSYVKAVKQVYQEFKKAGKEIYLFDMFDTTKSLYEAAYKADSKASGKTSPLAAQLFDTKDLIHSSKLGGFIQSAQLVGKIKESGMGLSSQIKVPKNVTSIAADEKTVALTVNHASEVTGYALTLSNDKYTAKKSDYWTKIAQKLIDKLK